MHAANPDNSVRLQRILRLLRIGGWHTSRDLAHAGHTVSPSACVSELRQAGYRIECERVGRLWRYRLEDA